MDIKEIRRINLREAAKSAGGVTALARALRHSQSQISHLIGAHPSKNIGNKLAAEFEAALHKPPGWLDELHDDEHDEFTQLSTKTNHLLNKAPEKIAIKKYIEILKTELQNAIANSLSTTAEVAFEEGKTIGIKLGEYKMAKLIITRLTEKGYNLAFIAEITDLSADEINRLHNTNALCV